jgi:hypothetical protein
MKSIMTLLRGSVVAISVCLLTVLTLSGCGGDPKPTTDQAAVSGTLLFDGKPVTAESSVVFYNEDAGATAAGKVDSLGKFQLKGTIPSIGIPIGRYKVMVSPPTTAVVDSNDMANYNAMMSGGGAKAAAKPKAPSDIPAEFLTLKSSTMSLELKAGENALGDIDLKKIAKN